MKFIIKPFAEIMVKSKPVRKKFLAVLQTNITNSLKRTSLKYKVSSFWDFLEVNIFSESFNVNEVKKILGRIPGIDSFLDVEKIEAQYKEIPEKLQISDNSELKEKIFDLDYLGEKVYELYEDKIKNGNFAVRVKRVGKHDFTSSDAERYIGGYLLKKLEKNGFKGKVKLKNPDTKVEIEINANKILIVKDNIASIGGYPVGTQEKVISLISGGFDSGVSTYSMMKRGCKVDFLFFNLGGSAHELGVKQVAYYLNQNFSCGYNANIIVVPFEEIIKELLTKIDHKYRGILLKRYMLRIADKISQEYGYLAVVKGDSLGQVSSQTLKNMFVIDKACDTLVLRPLITYNKQEIVDLSMKIGTYNFAVNMPEYCGVISDRPSTGAKLEDIENEELKISDEILLNAYNNKKVEKVENLVNDMEIGEIQLAYLPGENEVIVDIREKAQISKNPIKYENTEIIEIPFFDINNRFKDLDQNKVYLFYCDKGVLSNLHGLYLKEKGFNNIKIFRPERKYCITTLNEK